MSTESPSAQVATGESPSERETLNIQTEFIWQVLKETANGLMKTIAEDGGARVVLILRVARGVVAVRHDRG